MASFSASLGFLVTESDIPIVKEIGKRTFFHGNYTWAVLEAKANRLIMIDGTSYSEYLVRNRFTNRYVIHSRLKNQIYIFSPFFSEGIQSHYCINEKFATFAKTFTVPQSSIYAARMDIILLRIVQAGLNEKYRKDELEKFSKGKLASKSWQNAEPLGMEELQAPIILLFILHGISTLIFIKGTY